MVSSLIMSGDDQRNEDIVIRALAGIRETLVNARTANPGLYWDIREWLHAMGKEPVDLFPPGTPKEDLERKLDQLQAALNKNP
jgi:hypothetical protein